MVTKEECDVIIERIENDEIEKLKREVENLRRNIVLDEALKETAKDPRFEVYKVEHKEAEEDE